MRRRPGRPLVIAAAAVTFLLASGCGGQPDGGGLGPGLPTSVGASPEAAPEPAPPDGDAGSSAPGLDPCAVLTAADVEQVLGEPVDLVNDEHGCDYLTRGQPATMVGVSVNDFGGTVAEFERLTEASAGTVPGTATWPVDGLGEAASAVAFAADVQLFVKVGDVYLVFNVIDPSGDPQASLAVLQRVALAAVPRAAARG